MSDTAGHSAAIADFLEMMAAERGAAANTLAAYARDLDQVEAVIGDLLEAERARLAADPFGATGAEVGHHTHTATNERGLRTNEVGNLL